MRVVITVASRRETVDASISLGESIQESDEDTVTQFAKLCNLNLRMHEIEMMKEMMIEKRIKKMIQKTGYPYGICTGEPFTICGKSLLLSPAKKSLLLKNFFQGSGSRATVGVY